MVEESLLHIKIIQQNGAISVPDTVEDDGRESDGSPSDDLESALPADSDSGAVKFGWIKGVLVSYAGSGWEPLSGGFIHHRVLPSR